MGLDLGLEQAGFQVNVAVEINKYAIENIKQNRPNIPVIPKKIEDIKTQEILDKGGLKVGEATVVTGGPACQSFSTAGSRGSINDPRGGLFKEFIRVVNEASPRFFVMENVKGILSAAIKHRPLKERGPGFRQLSKEEELGSAFRLILEEIKATGYYVVFGVLNSADYGVPQKRQRLIVIGSRDGEPIGMPNKTHEKTNWVILREALKGLDDPEPEYREFSEVQTKYLQMIPEGGNWHNLPKEMQPVAIGGAYKSWGGRTGFLRRLSWNKPSPALTTNPNGKATLMCHPVETRTLSVKEYARIQQFPDDWYFSGSISQKYTQIGNAVPIGLGYAIGETLLEAMRGKKSIFRLGSVITDDSSLVDRIANRPKTILNPPGMREIKGKDAEEEWLGNGDRKRSDFYDFMETLSSLKAYPDTTPLNGLLPGEVNKLRWKAHRLTLRLHSIYGSPNLGNKPDPVDELIYIILSLMTTEPSYSRVYDKLKEKVGTWSNITNMHLNKLKSIIKDAGLSNQKSKRIKAILNQISDDFGEVTLDPLLEMSDDQAHRYLTSLPGIGVKAAKCVLMYSLGRQVLPVDTHVKRVATRLGLAKPDINVSRIHDALEAVVPPTDRYSFHVNAIAHGRELCLAKEPRCNDCKLKKECNFFRTEGKKGSVKNIV